MAREHQRQWVEIDFLNDIHAFNFKPIAIFQGKFSFFRAGEGLTLSSYKASCAAEQTGLRDYMASKVDCKCVGNKVGVAA